MPSGPPLLKERRHLTDKAAEQMWLSLQTKGWKPLQGPTWVETADIKSPRFGSNQISQGEPPLPERQSRNDCGRDRRGVLVDG